MQRPWMIYGAYGYSGRLIAELAASQGLKPVLAGRDSQRLAVLASALNLEFITLDLAETARLAEVLERFHVVLHCAGPFSATSRPMLDACLGSRCSYLDITGEISVFEAAHERDAEARKAGVVVCPGVGFDVIPTDSVAAKLKEALPDANHLALGFDSKSGLSPGTAKTSIEGLANGCWIRRGGLMRQVPLAWRTRKIDFGAGTKLAMTIPWGDVATAWYSTGIPDIEAYIPASPRLVARLKRLNPIRGLLGLGFVQSFLKKRIEKRVRGPDEASRQRDKTYVWGEASNAAGSTRTARLVTGNGYTVTAYGALGITRFVLENDLAGGYYTPSTLIGSDFVSTLPGSGPITLD